MAHYGRHPEVYEALFLALCKGNASRTAVEQWLDVSWLFPVLHAIANALSLYTVKLTAEEHRTQPGAKGRIIRQLEEGMKGKVTFGTRGANSLKTLVANLPEVVQRTFSAKGALEGIKKEGMSSTGVSCAMPGENLNFGLYIF